MRVAFFQFAPMFARTRGNAERMARAVEECGADLVVMPELATSGYLFTEPSEVSAAAEVVPGPTTELLQRSAAAASCRVVVGMAERRGERIYNSAVLVGPEGIEGVYRKVHLFFEEKLYFSPGDLGFPLFDVGGARVGLLVCFDHLFPEAARTLALQGAQVICHPSNLVLPEYGQLTTRVRSIENRVFWVLCNRSGSERRGGRTLRYTGASQITAPDGKVLAAAGQEGESLQVVEIDPARADDKKVTERNDLFADRRPDTYRLERGESSAL
jgi:predicted amidohydrolase